MVSELGPLYRKIRSRYSKLLVNIAVKLPWCVSSKVFLSFQKKTDEWFQNFKLGPLYQKIRSRYSKLLVNMVVNRPWCVCSKVFLSFQKKTNDWVHSTGKLDEDIRSFLWTWLWTDHELSLQRSFSASKRRPKSGFRFGSTSLTDLVWRITSRYWQAGLVFCNL